MEARRTGKSRRSGPSLTRTPYRPYLDQRWREGCRNAAALWRELVGLGFDGRSRVVRAWATEQRRRPVALNDQDVPARVTWKPPSITRATRLVQADPATLSDPDRAFTERLLAHVDGLAEDINLANRLGLILRKESKEDLDDWLNATEGTALATFATGLRKDLDAVKAALALPWTTGPVEGQINRLKMVKRTMYGRAGFQLLRHRVLEAA
jgi:transposase